MTTGSDFFGGTSFLDFLEEEPRTAFFSFQDQFGKAPAQQRYFQGQFQNIQNEFLGQLGQQIRGGGLPTLRFADFLSQFPFTQRYAQLSPFQRGERSAIFNPRTRFLPF